jgi:hypothetical protein
MQRTVSIPHPVAHGIQNITDAIKNPEGDENIDSSINTIDSSSDFEGNSQCVISQVFGTQNPPRESVASAATKPSKSAIKRSRKQRNQAQSTRCGPQKTDSSDSTPQESQCSLSNNDRTLESVDKKYNKSANYASVFGNSLDFYGPKAVSSVAAHDVWDQWLKQIDAPEHLILADQPRPHPATREILKNR